MYMKYLIAFILATIPLCGIAQPLSYFMEEPKWMGTLDQLESNKRAREEGEFRDEQRKRWAKEDAEEKHRKVWGYGSPEEEMTAKWQQEQDREALREDMRRLNRR